MHTFLQPDKEGEKVYMDLKMHWCNRGTYTTFRNIAYPIKSSRWRGPIIKSSSVWWCDHSILVREEDKIHHVVCYVFKRLMELEVGYKNLEKFAYYLLMATRKLQPYFQEQCIKLLTNQPLKQLLNKLDTFDRLLKWVLELGKHYIHTTWGPILNDISWPTLLWKARDRLKKSIVNQANMIRNYMST